MVDAVLPAHRIHVAGDLDGSREVAAELKAALGKITARTCEVDATDARVAPEGMSTWIAVARERLSGIRVRYLDDELGPRPHRTVVRNDAGAHPFAQPRLSRAVMARSTARGLMRALCTLTLLVKPCTTMRRPCRIA